MQVIILAGGRGKRLKPLTNSIPKVMIKINGSPFLEILLKFLKSKGFLDFILCVGYLSEVIEEYFENGSKLSVKIDYSKEKRFLGTAGAIKNANELLDEEFIVINGDTFVDLDFKKMIEFSRLKNKLCSVMGFKNKKNDKDFY